MSFDLTEIHYGSVLAGAIFYMVFGALYYSPVLFGNAWSHLNNVKEGQLKNPLIYVGSTAAAFLSSFIMALLIQATGFDGLQNGLAIGLMAAVLIALVYMKNAAFGLMSKKVYAIAVGEHFISFTVLGILHGVWS